MREFLTYLRDNLTHWWGLQK